MVKKILIGAILLGLFVAGSLIAEERFCVIVHITEGEYGLAPNYGTVYLDCEYNDYEQDYDGPRDYYFLNVPGMNCSEYATASVEAGEYYDEQTIFLTQSNNEFYLHLPDSIPKPPPDDPPNN